LKSKEVNQTSKREELEFRIHGWSKHTKMLDWIRLPLNPTPIQLSTTAERT